MTRTSNRRWSPTGSSRPASEWLSPLACNQHLSCEGYGHRRCLACDVPERFEEGLISVARAQRRQVMRVREDERDLARPAWAAAFDSIPERVQVATEYGRAFRLRCVYI